jgi:hypothetical protein
LASSAAVVHRIVAVAAAVVVVVVVVVADCCRDMAEYLVVVVVVVGIVEGEAEFSGMGIVQPAVVCRIVGQKRNRPLVAFSAVGLRS